MTTRRRSGQPPPAPASREAYMDAVSTSNCRPTRASNRMARRSLRAALSVLAAMTAEPGGAEDVHRGSRVPPVVWGGAAFGAQIVLSRKEPLSRARVLPAAIIAGASAWLLTGAVAQFLRQRTSIDPMRLRPASLVNTGPNRITRNPMYLGGAGFLAAHAVLRGSWRSLIPAGFFLVVIDRVQIPAEEAALRERLRADYERYTELTPRWLSCASLCRASKKIPGPSERSSGALLAE